MKYNHAYDFGFEVISENEEGEDVTASMLRVGIAKRLNNMSDAELLEACDRFDTMKHEVTDEL